VTDIFSISSRFVDEVVALNPEAATQFGIPGYDHLWNDTSPEGFAANHDLVLRYQREVDSLQPHLDRWHVHGRRVLQDFFLEEIAEYEEGARYFRLSHVAGVADDLREIFDLMDTESDAGWDNIATRLETIDQPLAGWRETFEEGRRAGRVVPRRQVTAMIEQFRHLAGPDSHWMLLEPQVVSNQPDRAERVQAAIAQAQAEAASFADYLEQTYAKDATTADGAGLERYLANADRFLGMRIDPVETYEWGWSEVRRLHDAMNTVARQIDPDRDLADVIELLETEPRYLTESPAAFAEFIQDLQNQALGQLDGTHFDVPEQIRQVKVNMVPPGGALGAYYVQPSEDFARPGSIWYSFGERQQLPLWSEVSTGYHEGFPGHHLQLGTALAQRANLTRAHRLFLWHSGYGEGWALYTERLMDELGYFEKPEYLLGMLSAQQLRACRVVIDIGCHLGLDIPGDGLVNPGGSWDFDTGVQMLHRIAGLPPDQADSEVKRYFGWPAQAISYKVGERAILDMREQARRKHGPSFDLKEFHRRLLEGGDARLDYLATLD